MAKPITRAELKKLGTLECSYNEAAKATFHRIARKLLVELNAALGIDADIRRNLGGIAVSGEATLHSDSVYVQVSQSCMGPDMTIMYRTCKDRKDYSGGYNNFYPLKRLAEDGVKGLAQAVEKIGGSQLANERMVARATAEEVRVNKVAADLVKCVEPAGVDFRIRNEGSIVLLKPISDAAREWVSEHIPEDAQEWAGAVVVEPRYIADILAGIQDSGLEVQ